jgi:hypothetical protein
MIEPNTWSPPTDFVQVASVLEGVSVYAPKPEAQEEDAPKTFTCPNCGAVTRYDVAAGGVVCEHCGYSVAAASQHVGTAAQDFEFTLETLKKAEKGWGVERRVLHCDNCGAELTVPEGALAVTCAFCASNRVNLRSLDAGVLRPRFLIPFQIKPETNAARLQKWLGQGWFHPPELAAGSIQERIVGMYLPFWTFSAVINAAWEAEIGHEHTHRDRNGNVHTEIHWEWKRGAVQIDPHDLLISGSSHVSKRILSRLLPFNLGGLVTYAPDYLAGWNAHAYDVTLPDAWEEGKETMREQAKKACYADIASVHVRNFRMNADFGDESWRYVLLPVYLASYRFQEKVFQVMVNGQTGTIEGQKPVAWWKVWLAVAAAVSPGLCLGLIGLPLLLAGGAGVVPIGLGFVLLVIGGVIAFTVYRKAAESEAA